MAQGWRGWCHHVWLWLSRTGSVRASWQGDVSQAGHGSKALGTPLPEAPGGAGASQGPNDVLEHKTQAVHRSKATGSPKGKEPKPPIPDLTHYS